MILTYEHYLKAQAEWKEKKLSEGIRVVNGFTVDPSGTYDRDDGLFYQRLDRSRWEIVVAIAYPAAIVEFDQNAFKPHRKLRNGDFLNFRFRDYTSDKISRLCSLDEEKTRPALGISIILDKEQHKIDYKVNEIIFHNERQISQHSFKRHLNSRMSSLCDLAEHIKNATRNGNIKTFPSIQSHKLPNNVVISELMTFTNIALAETAFDNQLPYLYTTRQAEIKYYSANTNNEFLNKKLYSNSTSPLRKFSDLCNNYNMNAFLNNKEPLLKTHYLDHVAIMLNKEIEMNKLNKMMAKQFYLRKS